MTDVMLSTCNRCGGSIDASDLACPACGLFTRLPELNRLRREAMQLESTDPQGAALVWEQALPLLPTNSRECAEVERRIEALAGSDLADDLQPNDPLGTAIFKTVGSMIVSVIVYTWAFKEMSWVVSAGFVILMLVHELGHVAALRWYNLRASPPVFIPFMGAIINLRQSPPDAKVEAVVGIGGPIAGTIGALVCYGLAWHTNWSIVTPSELFAIAYLGFLLNLFNLLPVPPLDGGRITAAISPWIWMLGVAGLIGLLVRDVLAHRPVNMILLLVIIFAFPRIVSTLKAGRQRGAYYDISRTASRVIALLYLCLGIVLIFMYAIMSFEWRGQVGI